MTGPAQPRSGPEPARQRLDAAQLTDYVTRALDDLGVEHEPGARAGEFAVVLPGETRLRTVCSLIASPRGVTAMAFVIRRPDQDHERFHRWLLEANLRAQGVAFAIDRLGDVYLVGRIPWVLPPEPAAARALVSEVLDALLGSVLRTADAAFNPLLRIGFVDAMRREWAWRTSRGESLANLEAFRDLLDP